jgi:hypothetical protein
MQTILSICNSSMRGVSAQVSRCATTAALMGGRQANGTKGFGGPASCKHRELVESSV